MSYHDGASDRNQKLSLEQPSNISGRIPLRPADVQSQPIFDEGGLSETREPLAIDEYWLRTGNHQDLMQFDDDQSKRKIDQEQTVQGQSGSQTLLKSFSKITADSKTPNYELDPSSAHQQTTDQAPDLIRFDDTQPGMNANQCEGIQHPTGAEGFVSPTTFLQTADQQLNSDKINSGVSKLQCNQWETTTQLNNPLDQKLAVVGSNMSVSKDSLKAAGGAAPAEACKVHAHKLINCKDNSSTAQNTGGGQAQEINALNRPPTSNLGYGGARPKIKSRFCTDQAKRLNNQQLSPQAKTPNDEAVRTGSKANRNLEPRNLTINGARLKSKAKIDRRSLHSGDDDSQICLNPASKPKRKNSKDVLCSQNTVCNMSSNRPSSREPFVLLCHNNDPPDDPYFPQASVEKADIKPVQATDDQSESYEESDPDGAARTSQLDQGIQFENGRGLPDGQYEQDEPRKLICFVVVFNRNLCRCLLLRAT